jgi:hypothetical protein
VDQSGFKDDHLCWGQVQDMALFDKIVNLPRRPKKPGEMNECVLCWHETTAAAWHASVGATGCWWHLLLTSHECRMLLLVL